MNPLLKLFLRTFVFSYNYRWQTVNRMMSKVSLMFVDPCITVQFIKKNPTRCNSVSNFYYSIFIWSSTCFGRHTAHYQEAKTTLAASGFSYMEGCLDLCCAWQRPANTRPTTFHVWKTRVWECTFRLLMMGGVSPKTRWALYNYIIIKVWYIVAPCWIFLYELVKVRSWILTDKYETLITMLL
jgi:hypothetical protein